MDSAIWGLVGAAGGVIATLYINSYSVIKKKTKAEAIQKLKIDSIVRIIQETDELQSGVGDLNVLAVEDIAKNMLIELDALVKASGVNSPDVEGIVKKWENKFIEDSRVPKKKIDKFAFLIVKDVRINKENREEYEAIKEDLIIVQKMLKDIIKTIKEVENDIRNGKSLKDIAKEFKTQAENRARIVTNFIDDVLIKYAEKLD